MIIASSAFENNQAIPARYTCDGENTSPPLDFSEVPEDAKSLALIMDDPDAPGSTFVHWVVWNIDPGHHEVEEGSLPSGALSGTTSFNRTGYGGPCPPSGTHRYFFKLFALDCELELPEDADKSELLEAMEGHVLERAELIGLYSRE